MDDRGHIYPDVTEEEAKKRNLIPIPKSDEERVFNMNRHERRKWAAQQRKARRSLLPSGAAEVPK
jgi:hypothetical protein